MTRDAGLFLGSMTTAEIHLIPIERRKMYNVIYDSTTFEMRMFAVDGEAYPSVILADGVAVGGIDKQIQFNDGGIFGGTSNLWWDKTNKVLYLDGGFRQKQVSTAVDYEMSLDDYAVTVDASGGTVDVTLPPLPENGHIVEIKARDITNTVRIIGQIDGAINYTFVAQYDNIRLMYNGDASEWEVR